MKDNNWQLHLPELKPVCQKCPKTVMHLQNHLLPAAFKRWNNLGEKGFSCSIFPDQHSVSLTACQITFCQLKAWVRNFIFASWFSALPFLSSAVPCQLLLSSWTTCSSFQFQNLNSNLWTLPKWEWQDFTDVILWELCTNPFSKKFQVYGQISPHLFHHPLKQIFHFTVILRLCTSQPQKNLIFCLFVFQLVYWSSVSDCL